MREHDNSTRGKSVESVPAPSMQEKFRAGLCELIALGMDGGMTTHEMVPIFEEELRLLRRPFQNPEDNDAKV